MKIEFLDEKMKEARLTRGIFRKYSTIVFRGSIDTWYSQRIPWQHGTGFDYESSLPTRLNRRIEKRRKAPKWEPVVKPPKIVARYRNLAD